MEGLLFEGVDLLASSMSMKWCKKNLDKYSQSVFDLLKEEYPDLEMEVTDCVDACGLCTDVPFALRNNAIVSARDARGLYVKLKRGMSFMTEPALPGTYEAVMAAAATHSSQEDPSSESDS